MTRNRRATTIGVFLAFVVVPLANAGAAAEPELPPCQANPWRPDVVQ